MNLSIRGTIDVKMDDIYYDDILFKEWFCTFDSLLVGIRLAISWWYHYLNDKFIRSEASVLC